MTSRPDLSIHDGIEQALQTFLVVVHTGTEIGNHFERPTLAGAVEFQHLFLPLQIALLVVARKAGIGHGAPIRGVIGMEQLRLELGQIVPALPSRRPFWNQFAFDLPAAQRRDRHAQRFRGFAYRYISIHNGYYKK